jgi:hypothetical protein
MLFCYKEALGSHHLSLQKENIYKTNNQWPMEFHWPLTKAKENKLRIFERKALRRIYGPAKDNCI